MLLRSWIFEGAIDGELWMVLDHHAKDTTVHNTSVIAAFAIAQPIEVRMVRLRQIGLNGNYDDRLCLSAPELFGRIFERPQ
jgi:hypothetical protein